MGRKKHKGPREANGQLSRAVNPRAERKTDEAADLLALEIRLSKQAEEFKLGRYDKKGNDTIRDQKRGTYIGVLRMLGEQSGDREGLSDHQYRAGERATQIWVNYCRAIDDQNTRLKQSAGGAWRLEPDADEFARICDKARSDWQKLRDCAIDLQNAERSQQYIPLLHALVTNKVASSTHIGDIRSLLNLVYNRFIDAPKSRKAA